MDTTTITQQQAEKLAGLLGAESVAAMLGPQSEAILELAEQARIMNRETARRISAIGAASGCKANSDATWATRVGGVHDYRIFGNMLIQSIRPNLAIEAAALALACRHKIGDSFTAAHYRTLTLGWASVIGPAHPDDVRDGLVPA